MKRPALVVVLILGSLPGCGGGDKSTGDAAAAATDTAGTTACDPPGGTMCPPTAGNCMGIGAPCTKDGKQCATGNACDLDLSAEGKGICISLLKCTPKMGQCGKGATCCQTAATHNIATCLPNQCLPSDCTAE